MRASHHCGQAQCVHPYFHPLSRCRPLCQEPALTSIATPCRQPKQASYVHSNNTIHAKCNKEENTSMTVYVMRSWFTYSAMRSSLAVFSRIEKWPYFQCGNSVLVSSRMPLRCPSIRRREPIFQTVYVSLGRCLCKTAPRIEEFRSQLIYRDHNSYLKSSCVQERMAQGGNC